jgi:hypothetical protein
MPTYKRIFPRHKYETPIHYTQLTRNDIHESRIYNFCRGGIYFQPESSIAPESDVGIIMDNYSPGTFGPEAYRFYLVTVKWCREISGMDYKCYGVGAVIMSKRHEVVLGKLQENQYVCDLCGRLMFSSDLHKEKDSLFLCSGCHAHFKSIPEGHLKESIKRFMIGNVI